MGTGKSLKEFSISEVSGGVNYANDLAELTEKMSPDSMNVIFKDGFLAKRGGSDVLFGGADNVYDTPDVSYDSEGVYDFDGVVNSIALGYSLFDFTDPSTKKHFQILHRGSRVLIIRSLTPNFISIREDAPKIRSFNASVGNILIQTYADRSLPHYWDGNGSMIEMTNAKGFKRVLEFSGFIMGFSPAGSAMRVYYQPIDDILGTISPYADYLTLTPAPNDDEITEPFLLNGRLYVGTRYGIFRLSFVGGIVVFESKQVISDVGVIEMTAQVVNTKEYGQIVMFLGTDKRIYLFDGTNLTSISELYYSSPGRVAPISLDRIDDVYINNSFAIYDTKDKVYRLFVTRKGDSTNTYCVNVDVTTFAFYPFDNMQYSTGAICLDALNRKHLICVDYTGSVCKVLSNSLTDNGETINEYYTSPIISRRDITITQGHGLNIQQYPTSNGGLQIHNRIDYNTRWEFKQTIPCCTSKDRALGISTTLGTFVLGSTTSLVVSTIALHNIFNTYQFKIQAENKRKAPWKIAKMGVTHSGLSIGKAEPVR